jgi:putative membrane protein
MWGPGYGAGGWAMMIGSLILSVVVIAAIVVGIAWLVRSQQSTSRVAEGGTSARAILDARFARGEIDESELLRARQALAGHPPSGGPES